MANYTTFEAGSWNDLGQHIFKLGDLKGQGKLFLGDLLKTTGCEISMNRIEAGKSYLFHHKHRQQEEIYIVVSGRGEFQIDGEIFPVQEGSVVNIRPAGVRTYRASSEESLCYLCIQATENSLTSHTIGDGEIVPGKVEWPAQRID
ncbi:cupin domain-containing protein [Rubinisphaera sp.]|uniref:cupin domain-containing protein n=1 Tax=Rubinisphaera sp. TaxID=2024857 RepID=UPI000C0CC80F|nr:cupin domain-containing protein [Rubinisphaera sp.]MBV12354.1 cupin [Rubinisphaera sp.]HCS53344.1 cupin domain-containing protein [Planctomycetaceae bacterium]|tara:strand:+ start:372 stop:809 length:438 start_codon:yes stop_codon:yes gene_type:complete